LTKTLEWFFALYYKIFNFYPLIEVDINAK